MHTIDMIVYKYYNIHIKGQKGVYIMKKAKKTTKKNMLENKKCGAITCIHNVNNKCNLNYCDFCERYIDKEY